MATVLDHREIVTRKPHLCWGCDCRFATGARLIVHVEVDDTSGEFGRSYWCVTCNSLFHGLAADYYDPDGIGPGELRANAPAEWWAEFRKTWPPRRTA